MDPTVPRGNTLEPAFSRQTGRENAGSSAGTQMVAFDWLSIAHVCCEPGIPFRNAQRDRITQSRIYQSKVAFFYFLQEIACSVIQDHRIVADGD